MTRTGLAILAMAVALVAATAAAALVWLVLANGTTAQPSPRDLPGAGDRGPGVP
jgi:hypothetical protein